MPETNSLPDVSTLSISQATPATFSELYFQHTFLVFIQVGSKRVLCPINGELIGQAEDVMRIRTVQYSASLLDLMQAYARIRTRDDFRPFVMDRDKVFTMEEALDRMRGLIGFAAEWTDIASYLPEGWEVDPARRRSATASTFAASLELAKEGRVELRQSDTFAPIELRRRSDPR